jgi:hypothetical protein
MQQTLTWTEDGQTHALLYRTEGGNAPPKRVVPADDTLSADEAFRLASEGAALLWRGDFQNARQLLQALGRRADKPGKRKRKAAPAATDVPGQAFHLDRQAKAQRARTLGMLLIPFDRDYTIPLRRAPDVRQACTEAWGEPDAPFCVSLRELMGVVGAHEWRKKGVVIPALGARIHPHYGVYSPVRGEYVALVAEAPLPRGRCRTRRLRHRHRHRRAGGRAGTARAVRHRHRPAAACRARLRGRERPAWACAEVEVLQADLFPRRAGRSRGVQPALGAGGSRAHARGGRVRPGQPHVARFSRRAGGASDAWRRGLADPVRPGRTPGPALTRRAAGRIAQAGLAVLGRLDTRPVHPRAADPDDPLHAARSAEVTSLWRLGRA